MRISTTDLQRTSMNNILSTQNRLNKTMDQVSTGKRLQQPSDDPVAASRISLLEGNTARLKIFQSNNIYAENQLSLVESTLSSLTHGLMRVDELRMQAMNGHLQVGEREILATELENKIDELMGLANTKDADGHYLFSGNQSGNAPYIKQNGQYIYQGDNGERTVQVGANLRVLTTPSGYDLFENVKNGNGTFVTNDGVANNTGSAVISVGAVTDPVNYIADEYTITFVTNNNGDLAYQITGLNVGQVIPAPPATIPDDAPIFVSGDNIVFNGMAVQISGAPNVGDDFGITPSQNQNMLQSIQLMVDTLHLPSNSDNERGQYNNDMSRVSAALSQNMDRLLQTTTKIGASMKSLENEQEINEDLMLHNAKTLSALSDVDPAEAISRFMAEMTALQTAQLTYMRIQELTLFNYL